MAVRVAVVGLGFMGATHFKALGGVAGAEIVAVCDADPQRLEGDFTGAAGNIDTGAAARTPLSGIRRYKSFGRLLRDENVEMVDICLPTHLHAKLAVGALRAGKHVFCEKPMALNSRQARRMIDAARDADRLLMIGHCLRFWPEYEMLKGLVDSGKYGPVSSALFRRISGQPSWPEDNWFADVSRSGGCALDMHIHDADAVQWFFGVPQKVAAHGTVDDDGGVNQIFTSYRYDSDIVVMAEGAWLPGTYPFSMSARIAFESAVAEFDTARQAGLTIYEGVSGEVQTPTVPQADPYAGELGYFVDCVASGRPVERVTAQDAARAVAIVEAEIKSVKTGRAVKIRG